jgi:transcriptional regulator with XRE-family HTH domain
LNTISEILIKKLKENGLSIYALAKDLGISHQTLVTALNKRTKWGQAILLYKICKRLGLDYEEVILGENKIKAKQERQLIRDTIAENDQLKLIVKELAKREDNLYKALDLLLREFGSQKSTNLYKKAMGVDKIDLQDDRLNKLLNSLKH